MQPLKKYPQKCNNEIKNFYHKQLESIFEDLTTYGKWWTRKELQQEMRNRDSRFQIQNNVEIPKIMRLYPRKFPRGISKKNLDKHLKELKEASKIVDKDGKNRLFKWAAQHKRLKTMESLVTSMALSIEQKLQSIINEEDIKTRFSISEITDYFLNSQVLIFVPTCYESEKGEKIINYDLTWVPIEEMNKDTKGIWDRLISRREERNRSKKLIPLEDFKIE